MSGAPSTERSMDHMRIRVGVAESAYEEPRRSEMT
jgi:hypothetical protein